MAATLMRVALLLAAQLAAGQPAAGIGEELAAGSQSNASDAVAPLPARTDSASARCRSVRSSGASRVLFVYARDMPGILATLSSFSESGWQIGILTPHCPRLIPRYLCPFESTPAPSRAALPFSRQTFRQLTKADVTEAIADFGPSLVIPDLAATSRLLVRAYRSVEGSTDPKWQRVAMALRCSLPLARQEWSSLGIKSAMLDIARRVGVRVPRAVIVPATGASDEQLQQALSLVPVAIKSDSDGAGLGVKICPTRECVSSRLQMYALGKIPCTVQQYVNGTNIAFNAVFLDGKMVAGFAQAPLATFGAKGISVVSVTMNAPDAGIGLAALAKALGYTGVASADFRIDASGRAFMTDPNFRANPNAALDGAALGAGMSLPLRLRLALADEARGRAKQGSVWAGPLHLARSLAYARYQPSFGLLDLMLCDDVYVPVQWPFHTAVASMARAQPLAVDRATCEIRSWTAGFGRGGATLRQMCSDPSGTHLHCSGVCTPLRVRTPAYTPADLPMLCSAAGGWRERHTNCALRAGRPKLSLKQRDVLFCEYDRGPAHMLRATTRVTRSSRQH